MAILLYLWIFTVSACGALRSRRDLIVEGVALRHQLAVLVRSPGRDVHRPAEMPPDGRRPDADTVCVSRNKWLTAINKRGDYYLAIVIVDNGRVRERNRITDPLRGDRMSASPA